MEEQLEPRPEPKGTMTAGQLLTMTEEEEYANAGITKEEAEKKPPEIEDSTIAEEIEEAMKGEGDDLDKWNNWVEAANQKAEQEPEKEITGIGAVKGSFKQAEDGIRDLVRSRGLGDVYKRQA